MDQSELNAGDYLRGLRRNIWVIVLCALVGVAVGLATLAILPKTYEAQAKVLVRSSPADTGAVVGGRTTGQVNLDTEAQIATSEDVATIAADLLGSSEDPTELSENLAISVPANSSVLSFRYVADTPEEAALAADAFAQAYLDNRRQNAQSIIDGQAEAYTELLAELNQGFADATNEADRAVLLEQQIAVSSDLRDVLTKSVAPGQVISQAEEPSQPTTPTLLVALSGGAALGLLAGFAIAAWRMRRAEHTAVAADMRSLIPASHYVNVAALEDLRGLHSLGELLRRGASRGKLSSVVVMAAAPEGAAASQWVARVLAEHSDARASVPAGDVRGLAPGSGGWSGDAGAELVIWPSESPMSDPLSRWDAEVADEVVVVVLLHRDRAAKVCQDFRDLTADGRAFAVVAVDRGPGRKIAKQTPGSTAGH